jgi:hypothetical protein
MQLPGLFLNSGQQESLKEVKGISVENILSNITDLDVMINVSHKSIDLDKLKELTRLVIKSNYSRVEKVKLNIETKFNKRVLEVNSVSSIDKMKDSLPYILSAFIITSIFLFGLFYISKNVKKSLDGLNEVIAKKDLSGSLSFKKETANDSAQSKSRAESGDVANISNVEKYYKLIEQIKESLPQNYEVVSELISFNFQLRDFQKLVVLIEAIPADQKDQVYAGLSSENVKAFKDYLVFNGDDLYSDGSLLLESAQNVIKMLSLAAINKENFYSYYLKEISSSLNVKSISVIIKELTINEFMYFIEFVDKASLGFAIASSSFDPMKLSADFRELSKEEIKSCVDKISTLLMQTSEQDKKDPRESILPYLVGDSEAIVMKKLNVNNSNSFEVFVERNLLKVTSFIKDQDYEEIVWSLALFKESLRDEIIVAMPDILAERLLKETYKLSKESLIMKSIIITFLDQVNPSLEQGQSA